LLAPRDVLLVEKVDADDLVRRVVERDRAAAWTAADVQDPVDRLDVENAGDSLVPLSPQPGGVDAAQELHHRDSPNALVSSRSSAAARRRSVQARRC